MKKLIVNVSLVVVSVVSSLFLVEIGLRIFAPQIIDCKINHEWCTDDSVLSYVPKLSYKGRMVLKNQFDVELTTNSHGFRGLRDFSFEKPEGVKRILFLGDSFVFGWGVGDKSTFACILENRLNYPESTDRFEIINAGVYGYDIVQYREWFHRVIKYDPDVIFLGFCLENDFNITPLKNDTTVEDIVIENDKEIKRRIRDFINSLHIVALIRDRLYINFPKIRNLMLSLGVNNKRDIFLKQYPENLKRSLLETEKILNEINVTCQKNKIRFIIMLIPLKEQVYCRTEINKFSDYDIDNPNRTLKELLEKNNIEYLDLLPALLTESKKSKNRLYFDTDPHWTEFGNEVVAENISDFVTKIK